MRFADLICASIFAVVDQSEIHDQFWIPCQKYTGRVCFILCIQNLKMSSFCELWCFEISSLLKGRFDQYVTPYVYYLH